MPGYQQNYKRTVNEDYLGHKIEVVFYQPDYGLDIDGHTVGGFFVNTDAALKIGKQHIDELIDVENKRSSKQRH